MKTKIQNHPIQKKLIELSILQGKITTTSAGLQDLLLSQVRAQVNSIVLDILDLFESEVQAIDIINHRLAPTKYSAEEISNASLAIKGALLSCVTSVFLGLEKNNNIPNLGDDVLIDREKIEGLLELLGLKMDGILTQSNREFINETKNKN